MEYVEMRLVVLGSLVGLFAALGGLALFGLGWPAAVGIWLLGGPAGAVLAVAMALARQPRPQEVPARPIEVQRRAA
jgi:hypothetical protein